MADYIDPSDITHIRLIHEENIGSEGDWAIDGADDAQNYTEDIRCFGSKTEAQNAIYDFCVENGIPTNIRVREYHF